MIVTEMCVIEVTGEGLVVRELNAEFTKEEVQAATEAALIFPADMKAMA